MEQPSYYAILTADVRYDKNISAMSKLLFAEITALSNKEGYCWASNTYFGELYGVDKDTVSRWMSELVKAKYVTIEVDRKAGNLRKVYIEAIRKSKYPIRKNEDRYTQKDRDPIRKNTDIIVQENSKENKASYIYSKKELELPKLENDNRGKESPAKERLRLQMQERKRNLLSE